MDWLDRFSFGRGFLGEVFHSNGLPHRKSARVSWLHLGLWHATHKKDSLLERLFIVHRYLEGSGLDAGDTLLRRLSGVNNKIINEIVDTIVIEEVGHVQFGSRWYKHYIEKNKINEKQFLNRILRLVSHRHPRKDKLAQDLRIKAGFQEFELKAIEEFRNCF